MDKDLFRLAEKESMAIPELLRVSKLACCAVKGNGSLVTSTRSATLGELFNSTEIRACDTQGEVLSISSKIGSDNFLGSEKLEGGCDGTVTEERQADRTDMLLASCCDGVKT